MDKQTKAIKIIKEQIKILSHLHLTDPKFFKIVEVDVSEIGFGGILKQTRENIEELVQYHSGIWSSTQQNYSTIKKEILCMVLCILKFQKDLLNQKFLLRMDCKSAKYVVQKDAKNLTSK